MAGALTLPPPSTGSAWLAAKLQTLRPAPAPAAALRQAVLAGSTAPPTPLFHNPFTLDDLATLEDETLAQILAARA
ncbi:MAG TPA: hypothetical protein VFY89_00255, partial [Ktedonobacterales bacterium]